MIVIKDDRFEMIQHKTSPFFDLSIPVIVNAGTDKEKSEMKIVGYGMTFEACIKQIVSLKLQGEYSVSEYIAEYKKVVDDISLLITQESE